MKDAIEVSGLKKSYGSNMVLRGLDFQIKQGEMAEELEEACVLISVADTGVGIKKED